MPPVGGAGRLSAMIITPETATKLEHIGKRLRHEYPSLPAAAVDEVVDRAATHLLAQARFDQFVPLLAHRAAREQLAAANN
jgi:hypothetical protein